MSTNLSKNRLKLLFSNPSNYVIILFIDLDLIDGPSIVILTNCRQSFQVGHNSIAWNFLSTPLI